MIIREIKRREKPSTESNLVGFPAKLQSILASRGVFEQEDLNYSLNQLLKPSGLKNIQQASVYLFEAIKRDDFILIIGDFDADGATSSTIMIKALKSMGVKKIDFLVPDRFKFGYGLSVKLVEYAATLKPDLIVTVDNGIANIDGVNRANEFGIPVIITDHHLAAETLPNALSIVNPNQPDDEFESKNLAGVGVAFYLMLSLRSHMRAEGWFEQRQMAVPNLAELLDIVALGTVADVVPLDKNNRILVEQGLKRIRSGQACAGIKALLKIANKDETKCQASDLGFAIGPRINAAGRLEDMSVGISCLLAQSLQEALPIATRLDQLNHSRKQIESGMLEQANLDITAYFKQNLIQENESRPTTLCLFDAEWHQGVIGILASRVKEKINRPVIIFAKDHDSDIPMIKGSARSVKGVHIRDILALIDSRNPNLIEKFGGHAMAAGLSLKEESFKHFADLFHQTTDEYLGDNRIQDEIITDGDLEKNQLNLSFAKRLRAVGPWGQEFPEALFDDEFNVISSRIVGENHLKLVVESRGEVIDAIFFRCPESLIAKSGDKVYLVYKLDINEFRGNESVQLMVEQLEILK